MLLGFSPELVRDLVKQGNDALHSMRENEKPEERTALAIQSPVTTNSGLRLSYEVDNDLGHLVPRLRLIIDKGANVDTAVSETYTAVV
jgi:hypothetical protein